MTENAISKEVLNAAYKVHTALGPGLLESAYQECLFYEIKNLGLRVVKEWPIPLVYKEVKLECGYRADLFIESKFIVEVKSVDAFNDLHLAQILTYLKIANVPLGLLLNFNVKSLKDGIKRVINSN
ncbi:MAG: GxxExxY protein [Saprospiraceae bacterium]|nr:GxxExxY protein [Saprospiraceae bacterium]